jgi:uncharacterized protein
MYLIMSDSKRIVASGVTGLIGKTLCKELLQKGYELVVVTRDISSAQKSLPGASQYIAWTDTNNLDRAIDGAYGVINLAGSSIIGKRWTEAYKKVLFDSRINTVKSIVDAIKKAKVKPAVLISGSAVGYYGITSKDNSYTETDPPGTNFLSQICVAWEKEAKGVEQYGVRHVSIRTAIVLDNHEGALPRMLIPFYYYVGGPIGSGKQWFPWIDVKDEVGIIIFALENKKVEGPINAVSPDAVTNKEFSNMIGKVLHKPSLIPVPSLVLQLIFGEAAIVITTGVKVSSQKITNLGYTFQSSKLQQALESIINPSAGERS